MRFTIMISVLSTSLMASGCATKSQTGAATGAVGGAAVGGLIGGGEGALIGAALGGIAGWGVGKHMEREDERRMTYALEANRPMEWHNPETGNHYEVAPTRTFYGDDGRECRNFRMVADVNGQPDEVTGVACRNPNGSWDLSG